MNLSPHFTLEELTFSQAALRSGIPNVPGPAQVENLTRLCISLLEPIRYLLGCALHVDSGYRSPEINELVGSTAEHSAHIDGRAADIIPIGIPLADALARIRASTLGYDQLILECNAWIHVAVPPLGWNPRRQVLLAQGTPGHWTYQEAA